MIKNLFLSFLLISFLGGCDKQNEPIIIPSENPFEVMPSRFQQNVLLEYFSEESLSATVTNGLLVEQLKTLYPHRLFAANFHNNDFLATSYSNYISTKLGGLINISKGAINRKPGTQTVGGENGLVLLSPENWEGSVLRILRSPDAPLSLALETGLNQYDQGFVRVYVAHKEAIPSNAKLMVFLVEDNIPTISQEGGLSTFKHNNVLKTVLTSFEGDPIDLSMASEKGSIHKVSFSNFDIQNYNATSLKVIAFIYIDDPDYRKLHILNVQETNFYGNHYWDVDEEY